VPVTLEDHKMWPPVFVPLYDHVPDRSRFLDALSRPLPTVVWANSLRTSGSELGEILHSIGIHARRASWNGDVLRLAPGLSLGRTFPYLAGLMHPQEEASILAAHLLDVQPGEQVLDLCAAPGGKTAFMASRMNGHGSILANEMSQARTIALRANLDRLGATNVTITVGDATRLSLPQAAFDAVLADVPCSCTGTVRQNLSVCDELGDQRLEHLVTSQVSILDQAIRACRSGGRVLYTTCSLLLEENERVIAEALRTHGTNIRLRSLDAHGITFAPGITVWNGEQLDQRIAAARRLYPHMNDTGGFFYAMLEVTR
jgi:16S rRNA C967 or C1407 C5-methylase (RsmB/RsmF family)